MRISMPCLNRINPNRVYAICGTVSMKQAWAHAL